MWLCQKKKKKGSKKEGERRQEDQRMEEGKGRGVEGGKAFGQYIQWCAKTSP